MGRNLPPTATDERMPLPSRLGILVLFLCGAAGGLWQYANPWLTAGVLAGALPALALSFLPARGAGQVVRWAVQSALIGLALVWVPWRLSSTAIDLALIEGTAIMGLALLLEPPKTGYNVLAVMTVILLAYGGFIPARGMYLPCACLFLATGVWMLYRTRAAGLAEQRTHTARHLRTFRQERGFRVIHFLLFLTVAAGVFALLPPGGRGGIGIFPVSFATNRVMRYPKLWKDWWQTPWVQEAADGRRGTEDGRQAVREINPRAQRTVDAGGRGAAAATVFNGSGAAIGQDLVFRVKCAEKLYWLIRVYEEHDGTHWRSSRFLSNGTGTDYPPALHRASRSIEQYFQVETGDSPWLPGAFKVDFIEWDDPSSPGTGERLLPLISMSQHGIRLEDGGRRPPLPWQYHCRSRLPLFAGDQSAAPAQWSPDLQRLREVPPRFATPRVRQLAERLTAQRSTPYRKALALRDYLRLNYRYSLTPAAPPAEADPVDHFLFVGREGACSQFAQALTVLARAAGLPARIAAGYAPGNYNVVTGMFEVYQYHAHAWCQILVHPYGWLTFDGVAPGNLQLQSQPPVLGKLRDPFGDAWEAAVPELSSGDRGRAAASPEAAPAPGGMMAAVEQFQERIVARAQQESRRVEPDTPSLLKAGGTVTWESVKQLLAQAAGDWRHWLHDLGQHLARSWQLSTDALLRLGNRAYAGLALAGMFCLAGCLLRRTVARRWRKWRRHRCCVRSWAALRQAETAEPQATVLRCHAFCCNLLALWECRRPGNLDLMEYGNWLARKDAAAGADLLAVFAAFTQQRFTAAGSGPAAAAAALAAVRRLHARWRAGGAPPV